MRIQVIIPSRGAPFRLQETLHELRRLESGRHQVRYVVGVDHDDSNTLAMGVMLHLQGFSYRVFRRMACLGEMSNILARENPADAYCSLGSDLMPWTAGWDEAIYAEWCQRPDGVWWWRGCECPIISDKWFRAAGYLYTDYFPFWWDDNWLIQLWAMASGGPQLFIEAWLQDKPLGTVGMRDLRFWTRFYTHMKSQRQSEAARIAAALGWPVGSLEDETGDVKDHWLKMIDSVEQGQGDHVPKPGYAELKARAERLMAA
jgi:hypothetical protein